VKLSLLGGLKYGIILTEKVSVEDEEIEGR
jgi:hypothetical protein